MKIFNFLRRPYFTIFLSLLMLTFSCTQYEGSVENLQSFNYESFESFKTLYPTIDFNSALGNLRTENSTIETNRALLNLINDELGTDVNYPDLALKAIEFQPEEIISISLREGWISQKQANLAEDVMSDIQNYDFDTAITNLESNALSLSLSDAEFEKINLFANNLKSLNYENPTLFQISSDVQSRGGFRCALAVLALAAATAGLGSCATVVACGAAVLLHVNAMYAVADHCGEYLENENN